MVQGCPQVSPPWLLSDGRQARVGLGYRHYPILQLNVLQMDVPRVAICIPPSNGTDACAGAAHACPTQNFYKRGVHRISGFTFGWL